MGELRKPFLLLAMLAIVLVVLVETGSGLVLGGHDASAALTASAGKMGVDVSDVTGVMQPSGRGTSYLALIDVVALYTTALFCLPLIIPKRLHGRVQGIMTLIASIILIIVSFILAIIAFIELLIMVTLFLAAPFGTIAYLVLWGFFPVGATKAVLAVVLLLKLVYGGLLIAAQPQYLKNKGLMTLIVMSVVLTIVLAFLLGFIPIILVSIVDDLLAIIIAIIAIIWGIVLLIGSIPAIWKAIRVTAALAKS